VLLKESAMLRMTSQWPTANDGKCSTEEFKIQAVRSKPKDAQQDLQANKDHYTPRLFLFGDQDLA
jgi:hypothetical protein